ncbi:hypothetical protein [Pedobacter sp. MC2016-24]|uniref:hypothetical protein n=1 Tax=Pedobacter sp. MC2016-24 TaxID=2780090 RepID=UPI00187FCAA7|nr:hypothetical protein [Pedobacter sp. MC2016-24]MBE9602010.1 hypothetical protein [Pedobacter sp. MC2016-24]
MKKYLSLFLLLLSFSGFAQNTIPVPNYKYVLVPEKFGFLKEKNQYNLNIRLKSLLEDKGYIAYLDDANLPTEIANNKCLALSAEVLEKNSMFSTNLTLVLKDCKGNIIVKSKEGKSREKEYKPAFTLALMDAVGSIDEITRGTPPVATTVTPVQPVATPVAAAVNATTTAATVITAVPAQATANVASGTLYAQPTGTGFQLIDNTPKIVLSLFKTSAADYFIGDNGTAKGIVFKKDNNWVFEYYKNASLITESLSIKF